MDAPPSQRRAPVSPELSVAWVVSVISTMPTKVLDKSSLIVSAVASELSEDPDPPALAVWKMMSPPAPEPPPKPPVMLIAPPTLPVGPEPAVAAVILISLASIFVLGCTLAMVSDSPAPVLIVLLPLRKPLLAKIMSFYSWKPL